MVMHPKAGSIGRAVAASLAAMSVCGCMGDLGCVYGNCPDALGRWFSKPDSDVNHSAKGVYPADQARAARDWSCAGRRTVR